MSLNKSVKSISYLKANTATMINEITKHQKTFIITQNGEPKVVMEDIRSYEEMQGTMAMLKLLSMTDQRSKSAKGIKGTFEVLRNELLQ